MATKTRNTYLSMEAISYSASTNHPLNNRGGIVTLTNSRTGTPQPKYKQIIADEGNATTPLSATSESLTVQPGFTKYGFPDRKGMVYTETDMGIVPGNVKAVTGVITSAMRNEAEAKATTQIYKAIRAFQTPFEGQIFAGELKETFELIKNPLGKSAKLTDEFIRAASRDRSRTKLVNGIVSSDTRVSGAIADLWLEYSFGVLPLFHDIKDLLTLATDIALRHEHETIRGYGESVVSTSQVLRNQSSFVNGIGGYQNVDNIAKVQCIIRCGLTAQFLDSVGDKKNPYIDSFDDIMSIPVTAWELIPFSFLIDYFVNVGDIISSAVVTQRGLSYTSKSLVETRKLTRTSIVTGPDGNGNVSAVYSTAPKVSVYQARSVTRTSTLAAIPPLVFSLPGSKVRYANLTALLTKFLT